MDPGENCSAINIKFDNTDPRASFLNLRTETNNNLNSFINYYYSKSRNRKHFSFAIRCLAILSGVMAALSLNPLILEWLDEIEWLNEILTSAGLENDSRVIAVISFFIIITGGALSIDWAFAVTRKYTIWLALAYELGVEKAKFNITFSKIYMDKDDLELTQTAFKEACLLAQNTVKEFKDKQLQETIEWASNLQSVMTTFMKANKLQISDSKTAATKEIEKEEKAAIKTKEGKVKVGLTTEIKTNVNRDKNPYSYYIFDANGVQASQNMAVEVGQTISAFYEKGLYTVELQRDGNTIASIAVTLDKDKRISL